MKKYDVFISHSSKDQKIVEAMCAYLEGHKIRCFVSYRDIPKGVPWAEAIVDALDESRMMVVVFSEYFNLSKQVDREIELASQDQKPILTFRISDTMFKGAKKYYLNNLNWIDAFPNPANLFDSLLDNVRRLTGISPESAADMADDKDNSGEPEVCDDSQFLEPEDDASEDNGNLDADSSDQGDGAEEHSENDKREVWMYGVAAVLAVAVIAVICILVGQSSSAKREQAEADQAQYLMLVSSADSLSGTEATMQDAVALYDSAAVYELRYSGTRFSDLFAEAAAVSSMRVQSQIDSLAKVRQQESEARVRRELAAAEQARLEKERAEKERLERECEAQEQAEKERLEREQKEREEAERKRRETGDSNGILKVNGIEYPMVYVSGGSFMMGSEDSDAYSDEKPVHRVTLSSYRIGKYEVTQDLWEAVMGSNPSSFKGARKPVENVSWDDCQTFIRKLNSLTGQNFKLPTEAQWEFAARGGNSSRGYKYSGSNYIDNVGWYSDNSGSTTHNVGTKSPNELGIYDMSGNVWEWCRDWYGDYSSSSQTDPEGPSAGSRRVNRGGSWNFIARSSRVSDRGDNSPGYRSNYFGLRLCL